MCNPPENIHDLGLVDIRWHIGEDVAPRRTVVSTHGAGSTASDRINLGERRLCQEECIHNRLEVVIRVWICDIPLCLLGVENLVVLHSDCLDVALAKVKCQTAATGIRAANLRCVFVLWEFCRGDNLHLEWLCRCPTHVWHGVDLELVLTACGVSYFQKLTNLLRACKHQRLGRALPDHLLDQDAGQVNGRLEILVAFGKDWQLISRTSIGTRKRPLEMLRGAHMLQVVALGEHHWGEIRVQGRYDCWLHKEQLLRSCWHRRRHG
mmetsp:Transcript_1643/g.3048  ORF Transcript_1643/g.3048 Transcript_1643/m.3048 type:complete len:265 (+) Transcript_1643:865-1659(+)